MSDNFKDWILGTDPAPELKKTAEPDLDVADNQQASWLIRLAGAYQAHAMLGGPQSFTWLRLAGDLGIPNYSLAGILCQMYIACGMKGAWKPDGSFGWTDRIPDNPGNWEERSCLYAIPEPVLWWALQHDGGHEITRIIHTHNHFMRFLEATQACRNIDDYLKKLGKMRKAQQAFQANHQSDQAMRNARRLQEQVRNTTKPKKPTYNF